MFPPPHLSYVSLVIVAPVNLHCLATVCKKIRIVMERKKIRMSRHWHVLINVSP